MPRHIHVFSSVTGSLGEITKDIVSSLSDQFFITEDVKGELPKVKDIFLCHFTNNRIVRDPEFHQFKKKILIQPVDGNSLVQDWVSAINAYDLVITPGTAGKDIMIENGVTVPIEIVPNFYKDEIFEVPANPSIRELRKLTKNKVVFYFEGQFIPRKGVDVLYRLFIEAFADTKYVDDVVLIFKSNNLSLNNYKENEGLKKEIFELQKNYKKSPLIVKISQFLKTETLVKLWELTDVYFTTSRFEGFGIPIIRMAALQKPIIALDTSYNGYMDFLNEENAYLIPTVSILAKQETIPFYTPDTKWATPINTKESIKVIHRCLEDLLNKRSLLVDREEIKKYHIDNVMGQYKQIFKTI